MAYWKYKKNRSEKPIIISGIAGAVGPAGDQLLLLLAINLVVVAPVAHFIGFIGE